MKQLDMSYRRSMYFTGVPVYLAQLHAVEKDVSDLGGVDVVGESGEERVGRQARQHQHRDHHD